MPQNENALEAQTEEHFELSETIDVAGLTVEMRSANARWNANFVEGVESDGVLLRFRAANGQRVTIPIARVELEACLASSDVLAETLAASAECELSEEDQLAVSDIARGLAARPLRRASDSDGRIRDGR